MIRTAARKSYNCFNYFFHTFAGAGLKKPVKFNVF
jgi:hypothetical protein